MDALEDWHVDQVRAALRQWREEFPNKKPNPGHVLKLLKERRGRAYVTGATKDPLFAVDREVLAASSTDRLKLSAPMAASVTN